MGGMVFLLFMTRSGSEVTNQEYHGATNFWTYLHGKGPRPRYPRVWKANKRIGTISKSIKLVESIKGLSNVKEEVYGALDSFIAWELEFPLITVKKALKTLENKKERKRIIQVFFWQILYFLAGFLRYQIWKAKKRIGTISKSIKLVESVKMSDFVFSSRFFTVSTLIPNHTGPVWGRYDSNVFLKTFIPSRPVPILLFGIDTRMTSIPCHPVPCPCMPY